jgi:SpoVK/Ycf46/Vps4 family AAA+-type ATPase
MDRIADRKSPVGSVLMGAITFLVLVPFNYFTLGMVVIISATVALVSFFKPKFTSAVLLAFLLIPAISVFPPDGANAFMPLMVVGLSFAAVLLFCLIDWFGALLGLWFGLLLYSPAVVFLVLPALAAVSVFGGMKKSFTAALVFAVFGAVLMNSLVLGFSVPDALYYYTAFFPNLSDISSIPFASTVLFYLFGPSWQVSLGTSTSGLVLNSTPVYFIIVSISIILLSFYLCKLLKRTFLNRPLSGIVASVVGASIGASLYGTLPVVGISAAVAFLAAFCYIALTPLFLPKPRLSAQGIAQIVSKPALLEASAVKQNGSILVEKNPSKAFKTMDYWEKAKGLDGVKEDLFKSVVLPMHKRSEAERFGVKPVKGILLYGPPGTGKTILLRGLASKLAMTYVEVNPGTLLSKWYGESEQRMRDVVETALADSPSILAIDEIDSIGKERTSYAHDDITPRVLNVLLMGMDKIFQSDAEVLMVATTNRPQMLDKALLRAGRFDKIIYVGPPDQVAREEIFRLYLGARGPVVADGVDYARLASMSERFTGADIEGLVNSVMSSAFYNKVLENKEQKITQEVLEEAIRATRPSMDTSMIEEYEKFRVSYQRDKKVVKGWESGISNIGFDDIGDLEEIKASLKESFQLPLEKPELLKRLGVKPVKGILLYGPPGNGKTLLAKAVANEVSANFFTISGADMVKRGSSQAAAMIKELFNLAKDNSPAIIFVDELDQLAPDRNNPMGADFMPITTELLGELDGVKDLNGVMVLAATNRPESVEQALLRPGRLEKHLYVQAPDEGGRMKIFEVCLRGANVREVSVDELAKLTTGFSGAEICETVNNAKKVVLAEAAGGSTRDWLTIDDFREALERKRKETINPSLINRNEF